MSKLIEAIEARQTGNRVPGDLMGVSKLFSAKSDMAVRYQDDSLYEYELGVQLGLRITIRRDDKAALNHYLADARRQIAQFVFGEFRDKLYEIKRASYERDWQEVNKLLDDLHGQMFDV